MSAPRTFLLFIIFQLINCFVIAYPSAVMVISYNDTISLIDFVLKQDKAQVRKLLNEELKRLKSTEQEFYAGVMEHGKNAPFTSDQWFDFHSKIPDKLLRRDQELMAKLSPRQREMLETI